MKTFINKFKAPGALITGKKLLAAAGFVLITLSGTVAQNASYSANTIPINGTNCTAFGYQSLFSNNIGISNNSGFGYKTLYANTTGTDNTAIGFMVLPNNTTGRRNSGIGLYALNLNTTGEENTATGWNAMYSNTTAYGNTANGSLTLYYNTIGNCNTAMGTQALYTNTSGAVNVAVGNRALYLNTTGFENQAVGTHALYSNTTGYDNSAMGYQTMYNTTTGYFNTAAGVQALYTNTTGVNNTANGYRSMYLNTTGDSNAVVGMSAMYSNTSGRKNAAIGFKALYTNTTGTANTALGYKSDVGSTALTNATAVGSFAVVSASNKIRFGDASVTVVEGPVSYTVSDGRFKNNISESDVKGLEFIKMLRPVVYNFDTKELEMFWTKNMPGNIREEYINRDFSKSTAIRQSGFIAQEVEAAAKASGYDFNGVHTPENENDNYSLAYGQFVVPLVKGMQEQQQMIEQLKNELQELKTQLAASTGNTNNTADAMQIFPNPGKGLVTMTTPAVTKGTIEIFTLEGKSIYTSVIAPGTTVQQLDLTTQAKGVYMVKVVSEGKVIASQKLIIE